MRRFKNKSCFEVLIAWGLAQFFQPLVLQWGGSSFNCCGGSRLSTCVHKGKVVTAKLIDLCIFLKWFWYILQPLCCALQNCWMFLCCILLPLCSCVYVVYLSFPVLGAQGTKPECAKNSDLWWVVHIAWHDSDSVLTAASQPGAVQIPNHSKSIL